jgi:hypothetical protein
MHNYQIQKALKTENHLLYLTLIYLTPESIQIYKPIFSLNKFGMVINMFNYKILMCVELLPHVLTNIAYVLYYLYEIFKHLNYDTYVTQNSHEYEFLEILPFFKYNYVHYSLSLKNYFMKNFN